MRGGGFLRNNVGVAGQIPLSTAAKQRRSHSSWVAANRSQGCDCRRSIIRLAFRLASYLACYLFKSIDYPQK